MVPNHNDKQVHDFDENARKTWTFKIGGHVYVCTYPTLEETEQASEKLKTDKEWTEWVYSLVTPAEKDGPSIKKTIAKEPVPKVKAFQAKLLTEVLGET